MGVHNHLSGMGEVGWEGGILDDKSRGPLASASASTVPGARPDRNTSKSWECLVLDLRMFFVRIEQQTITEKNRRAHTMMAVAPVAKDAHCMLMREKPPEDWMIVFSVSSVCWPCMR